MNIISIILCAILVSSTISTPKIVRKGIFGHKTTHFTFNATVNCPLKKKWCVQLDYFEYDLISNDFIGMAPWSCTEETMRVVKTVGSQDGDGFFDDWYELLVKVTHNCREENDVVFFNHDFPDVSTDLSSALINYNISI